MISWAINGPESRDIKGKQFQGKEGDSEADETEGEIGRDRFREIAKMAFSVFLFLIRLMLKIF